MKMRKMLMRVMLDMTKKVSRHDRSCIIKIIFNTVYYSIFFLLT